MGVEFNFLPILFNVYFTHYIAIYVCSVNEYNVKLLRIWSKFQFFGQYQFVCIPQTNVCISQVIERLHMSYRVIAHVLLVASLHVSKYSCLYLLAMQEDFSLGSIAIDTIKVCTRTQSHEHEKI